MLPPLPAAARKVGEEGRRDALAGALMDYCQESTTTARVTLHSTAMAATALDIWETVRVILRPTGISMLLMVAMAATAVVAAVLVAMAAAAMVAAVLVTMGTVRVILRPAGTSTRHMIVTTFWKAANFTTTALFSNPVGMVPMATMAMAAAVLVATDTVRVILRPAGIRTFHMNAKTFCSNQVDLVLMARFLRRRCKGPWVQRGRCAS